MQTIKTIGLDIAKSVFQVHGIDAAGIVTVRRQLKRRYVLALYDENGQFVSERSRRSALPGGRAETPQRRNRRTRVSWPAAACERCNRSRSIRRRNTIAAGGARVCRARDAVVHVVARSASRPDQA